MKKDKDVYIGDIRRAIHKIKGYVAAYDKKSLSHDEKTYDAVIRNLEIIGEAAVGLLSFGNELEKELIDELRNAKGMRNVLIHNYDEVDIDLLWDTIQRSLPHLEQLLPLD